MTTQMDFVELLSAPTMSVRSAELTVLSFGGGQDSTALLYKFIYDRRFRETYAPGDLIVVMAETGNEHPETYEHVAHVKRLCAAVGIRFEHLTFDRGYHSGGWKDGLVGFYEEKKTIGSVAFPKTCSSNLKIEPIRRWLKAYCAAAIGRPDRASDRAAVEAFVARTRKIRMVLGIAAGEEKRRAESDRTAWVNACIENVYPLIDLGLDRSGCQRYIESCGQIVPPPSNCVFCPFKSLQEILWTYRQYPDQFAVWVALERSKLDANAHMNAVPDPKTGKVRSLNYGVKKLDTLPETLAKAQAQFGHMTDAELNDYRMSHGHCVTTAF